MTFDELKAKAHALPLLPGVYIMQDKKSTVIYVGKAKVLRNRVSQYFADLASHTLKTRTMVSNIDHFDVIVTDSEFEALILENSLIKRHQPRYNILLKDDKTYPYLRLSVRDAYPRFTVVGRVADDKARYFGPYGSRSVTYEILSAVRVAFRLPSCKKIFPRDRGRERPCLNYQMGLCDGYCREEVSPEQYKAALEKAVAVLNGHFGDVVAHLEEEMDRAASEMRFEQAALIRDRITALRQISKRQNVVDGSLSDADAVGWCHGEDKTFFVVLHFRKGNLTSKDRIGTSSPLEADGEAEVSAFLRQYYGDKTEIPREILLPFPLEDAPFLSRYFTESCGRKVSLTVPKKGEKRHSVKMAAENAAEEVAREETEREKQNNRVSLLGRMLALNSPPRRIESYDISNQGADDIVASMVVTCDGRFSKKDYRRFKLTDLDGPDDYRAMEETLTRRFRRRSEGDEKFGEMPDLLLIDGGVQHVRVAERVLSSFGLAVAAFGMVKDDRHRTRALVSANGSEIGIQKIPAVFAFVGQIQEETHRFAVSYHRTLQNKKMKESVLTKIPGIGPAKRDRLLSRFGSPAGVQKATREELAETVGEKEARNIKEYFS